MSYTNGVAAPGHNALLAATKDLDGLGGGRHGGPPADFGAMLDKAGGQSATSDTSTATTDVLASLREIVGLLGTLQGAAPGSQPPGAGQSAAGNAQAAAAQPTAAQPTAAQDAAGGDMLSQLMALLQRMGFKGDTPAEMGKSIKDALGKLEASGHGGGPITELLQKIATTLEGMGGQEGASQAGHAGPGQEAGQAAPKDPAEGAPPSPATNQADGVARAADALQRSLDRARDDLAHNDVPGALADLKQGQKEAMAALQGMPPIKPGNTNDLASGFFGRGGAESLVSDAGRPSQAAAA